MTGTRLEYGRWGMSYRFDDYIYLNENLKKDRWKKLRNTILKHERMHYTGLYKEEDFRLDASDEGRMPLLDLIEFHARHPLSLTQHLPVNSRGEIYPWQALFWITLIVSVVSGWILI